MVEVHSAPLFGRQSVWLRWGTHCRRMQAVEMEFGGDGSAAAQGAAHSLLGADVGIPIWKRSAEFGPVPVHYQSSRFRFV